MVPLPADLCADIAVWLKVRPEYDHDSLLTTRTSKPICAKCIYRCLSRLAKHSGREDADITSHILHHPAATLVLRNSSDLVATSRLLGHSSVAVIGDTYCHITNDYGLATWYSTNSISSPRLPP